MYYSKQIHGTWKISSTFDSDEEKQRQLYLLSVYNNYQYILTSYVLTVAQ